MNVYFFSRWKIGTSEILKKVIRRECWSAAVDGYRFLSLQKPGPSVCTASSLLCDNFLMNAAKLNLEQIE